MKILITGAAGFIGSQLSEYLLAQGHEVVGIDNLTPYYPVVLKRARLERLVNQPGFRFVEFDLCDYSSLIGVVEDEKVEGFCHLAAQPGVRYSLDHPFAYEKANLEAFLSVLETCRRAGIRRLVYASSSSVYGGNTKLPFSETDSVDRPVSLYAATKRANELMAHTYTHLYGFQTVGLRFFTAYGPWGRPDMAYWSFAERILAGQPIPVFNNGDLKRDFTYIDDIVEGVAASLFSDKLEAADIVNLGNHCAEPLMEFIAAIGDSLGVEPELDLKPMQPGDVHETFADIERARERLGFEPKTPMRDGIARFVAWYREHPGLVAAVAADRQR